MKSVVLPDDVWECIAAFLSRRDLAGLISLNVALYNIVLNTRYRELCWDKVDKKMLKMLVRVRTPSIAHRVRRLHVRAWFIEYLVRKESLTPSSFAFNPKRLLVHYLGLPTNDIGSTTLASSANASDILKSMAVAVRLMTQVTEYSFEWRDLSPTPDTMRFLSAARLAFGVSLRKLTLHAQLHNFSALLSTVDFQNLEELELFLDHDDSATDAANLLRDTIAPFVNHFRHTIFSLLLSSASKADMSPLLDALQHVPHLHKFVGRFAFDASHLSDPRTLFKFLRLNCTLTIVELGWSFAATSDEVSKLSSWGAFCNAVLADGGAFVNLSGLNTPFLRRFDDTMTCLRRSADTLTSLCLIDHFFREEELLEFANLFAHRPFDAGLQKLSLGLTHLTIETVDTLANRFPGLQSLDLVLPEGVLRRICHIDPPTSFGYSKDPTTFCALLITRSYTAWKLVNIGIWEKRFAGSSVLVPAELCLMQHLASRIPSVQTFRGEPKTEGKPCRVGVVKPSSHLLD
ncbi:hypothetical protein R3P38DRAFT_3189882 [Favolaschia claudopus]|uniref:F-box domain-containing protein n=1 Tax=Favolaschia claudopus TaxID=2862362 RepID=A0AAW0BQA0_9AGAR